MENISPETKARIDDMLSRWPDRLTEEEKQRIKASREKWDVIFAPLEQAITASERITERDLRIIVF